MAKHISRVLRWYFTPIILGAGIGLKIFVLFAVFEVFLSVLKESIVFADSVSWLIRASIAATTVLTGFYCLFYFVLLRRGHEAQEPFPIAGRKFEDFINRNCAGTRVGAFCANLLSALWPTLFAWFVTIAGYFLFMVVLLIAGGGEDTGRADVLLYNFSAIGLMISAWTIFLRVSILESGDSGEENKEI